MRTNTYFISDLHLGAGYISNPRQHELLIVNLLQRIAPQAKTIYLLGDIMDYWYEYHDVVPRGFVRFLGTLASLADQGIEIIWAKGNHDIWIYDYLPNEIGLKIVDGIIDTHINGKRFVMEHGDGVGEPRRSYRIMRRLFRNRFLQRLYSAIHPRWTVGFAHRWSKHSRLSAPKINTTTLPSNDPLLLWSENYMLQHGHVDYFIFGHRHICINTQIKENTRLIVLGDGFQLFSYAEFNGKQLQLKSMKTDKIIDI